MSLFEFTLAARIELRGLTGDPLIKRFMELRYEVLSQQFPHPVFSVGEATLDFFDKTFRYLSHIESVPKPQSEFDRNYINWLEKNQPSAAELLFISRDVYQQKAFLP